MCLQEEAVKEADEAAEEYVEADEDEDEDEEEEDVQYVNEDELDLGEVSTPLITALPLWPAALFTDSRPQAPSTS